MSDCDRFREELWEAGEGADLSPALTSHLEGCEACRRARHSLAGAARGLASLRTVRAPDPRAALWARLDRPAHARWWVPVAAASALAAAALVVLLARGAPRPAPPQVVVRDRGPAPVALAPRQQVSPPPAPQVVPEVVPVVVQPKPQPRAHAHSRRLHPRTAAPVPRPIPPASEPATPEPPAPPASEAVEVVRHPAPAPDPLDPAFRDDASRFTVVFTYGPEQPAEEPVSYRPTYRALILPMVQSPSDAPLAGAVHSGS